MLLKDSLKDQGDLFIPDRGGHVLTVTHTGAVRWLRLKSVEPRSLEADGTAMAGR